MKIQIIGVGRLGSQVAMMSMMMLEPEAIYLDDVKDLNGEWCDLIHARNGLKLKTKIYVTNKREADVYAICAGRARDHNETDDELLEVNMGLVWEIIKDLPTGKPKIIATNPVKDICYMLEQAGYTNNYDAEGLLDRMRRGTDCDGLKILKTKGFTNYGPAVAIVRKIKSVMEKGVRA